MNINLDNVTSIRAICGKYVRSAIRKQTEYFTYFESGDRMFHCRDWELIDYTLRVCDGTCNIVLYRGNTIAVTLIYSDYQLVEIYV